MIRVNDLVFSYDKDVKILKNLTFSVLEGENIAIVGSNGAGKSTLFFNLLKVLDKSSGDILIDGLALDEKNLLSIRKRAGLVCQNPDDQLFMNKVYDDIAFGMRNYGHSEQEVEKVALDVMAKLDITHLANRSSQRLSFGEKRRVAIATALAMGPKILLLDEPSSFLDPRARRNIIDLLKTLPHTKLIATHDLDLALELCERVIVLKKGEIIHDGATRDILTDKQLLLDADLELPLSLTDANCLAMKP